MGAKAKTGVTQVNFELSPELLDRVKAFAEERGQSMRFVMTRALLRHLDNPPPLMPDPPLPDGEPEPGKKPAEKKGGKKAKG